MNAGPRAHPRTVARRHRFTPGSGTTRLIAFLPSARLARGVTTIAVVVCRRRDAFARSKRAAANRKRKTQTRSQPFARRAIDVFIDRRRGRDRGFHRSGIFHRGEILKNRRLCFCFVCVFSNLLSPERSSLVRPADRFRERRSSRPPATHPPFYSTPLGGKVRDDDERTRTRAL